MSILDVIFPRALRGADNVDTYLGLKGLLVYIPLVWVYPTDADGIVGNACWVFGMSFGLWQLILMLMPVEDKPRPETKRPAPQQPPRSPAPEPRRSPPRSVAPRPALSAPVPTVPQRYRIERISKSKQLVEVNP